MKASFIGAVAAVLVSVTEAANVTYGRGSAGCGKEVTHIGEERWDPQFNVSGIWRAFRTYTPRTYDKDIPMPLIMAFHASAKTQPKLAIQSRFSQPNINPNMMVHYMTAFKKRWTGPNHAYKEADDFLFTEMSLDFLKNNYCIDLDRIYLVGHTGGAGFANMLACSPEYSHNFAAMALFGATLYRDLDDNFCKNARLPMPVFEAHGTNDGTSPYWGDAKRKVGAIPAIPDWIRRWVNRNKCDPMPLEAKFSNKKITSNKYTCDGQFGFVEHIQYEGRGYDWPTAVTPLDISPMIMSFLQRWVRPNDPWFPDVTKADRRSDSVNGTGSGNFTGPRTNATSAVYTVPSGYASPSGHAKTNSSYSLNPSSLYTNPTPTSKTASAGKSISADKTKVPYTEEPNTSSFYAKPTSTSEIELAEESLACDN